MATILQEWQENEIESIQDFQKKTRMKLVHHLLDYVILCFKIIVLQLSSFLAVSSIKHGRYLYSLYLDYFIA